MKTVEVTQIRADLEAICKKYGLEYVIAAGKIEDAKEDQQNVSQLFFLAPHLDEREADAYIRYNWLWRTASDIGLFARNMVDNMIERFKLVTIPMGRIKSNTEDGVVVDEEASAAKEAIEFAPETSE